MEITWLGVTLVLGLLFFYYCMSEADNTIVGWGVKQILQRFCGFVGHVFTVLMMSPIFLFMLPAAGVVKLCELYQREYSKCKTEIAAEAEAASE